VIGWVLSPIVHLAVGIDSLHSFAVLELNFIETLGNFLYFGQKYYFCYSIGTYNFLEPFFGVDWVVVELKELGQD